MEHVESNTDAMADFKNAEAYVEEVAIARITDEELFNLSAESLRWKSWTGFRIFLIMIVQGCCMAGYGIDWTVIGGINNFSTWHAFFKFKDTGSTIATFNALMTIGSVCAAPFLSLGDVIGRRGVIFTGNFIVLAAAFIQAFSTGIPMFMAGRFFLGFGSALMSQPQYIGEVAPTHLRGRLVGLYGACFQFGSVFMSAGLIGLGTMTSNWSWKIPLLLEGFFPAIVCGTIYFISPESPRYLILKGRKEEAAMVVARYHTTEGNNPDHPLVKAVVQQMEDSIVGATNMEVWDWRGFFKKGARSRVGVLIIYSIFQSWNGGGIIGQYLGPACETVGITSTTAKNGFSFGSTLTYLIFTVVGSFIIDKMWRRHLIFIGIGCIILIQTAITILSWQYTLHESKSTAILTIFFFFVFQACSATFIATMHNIYPVEILSLSLRAKGMGLYSLIQSAANTVQQYGIGVGFEKIGYKLWVVYIVYNTIQLGLSYFCFPETSALSLEEIDAVFETSGVKPVKMSLDIKKAQKEHDRLEAETAMHGTPAM
ncbi:MFS sugar transporter-like protein [Stipitochalara longipes BDJ]|nr:MFS sugar transporter-like protein [Stipitochalara longipes BDJ]